MKLNNKEISFIQVNSEMLLNLIDKELEELKNASVSLPTQEEREEARLVYLRVASYKGLIKKLLENKNNSEETGI